MPKQLTDHAQLMTICFEIHFILVHSAQLEKPSIPEDMMGKTL